MNASDKLTKESGTMKTNQCKLLLLTCVFFSLALPAEAADRVRAGQWVGTTTVKDKTYNQSNCMAQGDVDAMNGDAKSIQAYLEKTIPPSICTLSDFKVSGNVVAYTATCGKNAGYIVTTNYHGNSFESITTTGTKSEAKLAGACK